jgi:hypothetical protein
MTSRPPTQMALDLVDGQRFRPVAHPPEGLLQALAELLLGALDTVTSPAREACDEPQDHA